MARKRSNFELYSRQGAPEPESNPFETNPFNGAFPRRPPLLKTPRLSGDTPQLAMSSPLLAVDPLFNRRHPPPPLPPEPPKRPPSPPERYDYVDDGTLAPVENEDGSFEEDALFPMHRGYPSKLKPLCKIGFCGICEVTNTSIRAATEHFRGKGHAKKSKLYALDAINKNRGMNGIPLYCKYCDITLSSEIGASEHYKGKRHRKVINEGLANSREVDGVRERRETYKEDKTGRLGIGVKFAGPDLSEGGGHKFYCEICNIHCTSRSILEQHFNGAKHRKKVSGDAMPILDEPIPENQDDGHLLPVSFGTSKGRTLQNYQKVIKVPPGVMEKRDLMDRILMVDLQCKLCDVPFNDILAMVSHYQSQDHNDRVCEVQPFECHFCSEEVTGHSLQEHWNEHVTAHAFQSVEMSCDFCPQKVYGGRNMIRHLNDHIHRQRNDRRPPLLGTRR